MSDRLAQRWADAKAAGWAHYVRTENDERALLAGFWVDVRLGRHVDSFFGRYLRHSKGEWAGRLFVMFPEQRDNIIMPLFSWVRPDGRRRFTQASIWVAKKNLKSTTCAGLELYLLVADNEPGAEVYCAANDKKQAGIVFGEAANMVDKSPALRSKLTVIRSTKRIVKDNTSWIQALSAEFITVEGINAHGVIIDEIHAFNERGRLLRESLRHAGAARRQPMEIVISTAGDDVGPGRDEYEFADSVRKGPSGGGIADLHTFVYICEADPKDDPSSVETWKKANPGLGITITEASLREKYEQAKQSPRLMASFKRYRLNIWTGSETPWLDGAKWNTLATTLDEAELKRLICCGGLDLSTTTDLSAWVLAWKREDGRIIVRPHFWLPLANIAEREREDRCPYRLFAEQGWIELCHGEEIDQTIIEERILADAATFKISEIGFDRHQADLLRQTLDHKIGRKTKIVPIEQSTVGLGFGSQKFEELIKTGKIEHDGNPIMARHVDRVRAWNDMNGNVRPVKCDANRRRVRIDGVVAGIMAIGRVLLCKPRSSGLTLTRIL